MSVLSQATDRTARREKPSTAHAGLQGGSATVRDALGSPTPRPELWFHDATLGPRTAGWRRIIATSTAGEHPYAANWWPDAHVVGYEHGFTNMAADVIRVIAGQEPVVELPDFADAYETQRVLEAALMSAKERIAVRLSEIR